MSEIKIDINVKDIGLVKNLTELLEKHFEDLPVELQESLKELSEKGIKDFTADTLKEMFSELEFKKVDTSIKNVYKVNKLLKKVVCFKSGEHEEGDEFVTLYPETFYLKYDGKTIIEW